MTAAKKTPAKRGKKRRPAGAKERAQVIGERLAVAIPTPVVELDFDNAWQLLVATILAAQSTDKMINTITPGLFARWPAPADLAEADTADVEEAVKSSGFYRNKAAAIMKAARKITDDFGGEVPKDIDALVTVPGVGRKTANVVIGCAYRIPTGFVVDTHVTRLSGRLGLSNENKQERIEEDLCKLFDEADWIDAAHRLVLHGRYVCTAKKPDCARCPLNGACPSAEREAAGPWQELAARERVFVESRGAQGG